MSSAITVMGAGAWGTALAVHLARNGVDTNLWGRRQDHLRAMKDERENKRYLPDVSFPKQLQVVEDLESSIKTIRDVLIVVPSEGFRDALIQIKPWLNKDSRILWATKGFESSTGEFLNDVIEAELGDIPRAIVSGPSFAAELGKGLPTAVTVASEDESLLEDTVAYFHGANLRAYSSQDMKGVQLGGAIKNVMAIASGISAGLDYGSNARAALITRGLAEIMRLGTRLGAEQETLMGLAGVGDLVLTCTDSLSRNYRFGVALGRGMDQESAMQEIQQVVEGAVTAKVVRQVAQRAGVELPICEAVYRVLYEDLLPTEAVDLLLNREQRKEF